MQDVLAADAADDLAASIISMQDDPYADNAIDTVIYAGWPLCYWHCDLCRTTLMLLIQWFMQDDPYAADAIKTADADNAIDTVIYAGQPFC